MKLSLIVTGNFEILTIFVNACKATIFIIYYLIHIYSITVYVCSRIKPMLENIKFDEFTLNSSYFTWYAARPNMERF